MSEIIAHYVNDSGSQVRIITHTWESQDEKRIEVMKKFLGIFEYKSEEWGIIPKTCRRIEIEFLGKMCASGDDTYDTEEAFEKAKHEKLLWIEQWAKEHGYYKFLDTGNPSQNPTCISVGFFISTYIVFYSWPGGRTGEKNRRLALRIKRDTILSWKQLTKNSPSSSTEITSRAHT